MSIEGSNENHGISCMAWHGSINNQQAIGVASAQQRQWQISVNSIVAPAWWLA